MIAEGEALGPQLYGAVLIAKRFHLRKCGHHKAAVPATECIKSMIGKYDSLVCECLHKHFCFSHNYCFKQIFSLPVEVSHCKREMVGKRRTSADFWYIFFYHGYTGISLTTSNVLVTCNTTYMTGLCDNNCGITNFQCEVLTGHAHSTWNESRFEDK